jgi:hypothetical protein
VIEGNNENSHGLAMDFTVTATEDAAQFNGAEILDKVSGFIRKYVHLSDAQARIVTAWVAHTHVMGAWTTTPYLAITSALKQSGKTRLLEALDLLVNKPWMTGRVTAACLVRKVDQVRPTLLLDESDAAFSGEKEYAEALRGILNTGFYVDGVASCCVGQGANISYKDFKTFCAKAIAGIGQLPDTVADRSIPIRIERKRPGEVVSRFRRRFAKSEGAEIKSAVAYWIMAAAERLKEAEPELPQDLTDRQQDGLEPLLAIADEAGGEWPEAVRYAAAEIFRFQAADDQNIGVQLLADLRSIFESTTMDKIPTVELLEKLKEIEISPWADWGKGKGLTSHGLSCSNPSELHRGQSASGRRLPRATFVTRSTIHSPATYHHVALCPTFHPQHHHNARLHWSRPTFRSATQTLMLQIERVSLPRINTALWRALRIKSHLEMARTPRSRLAGVFLDAPTAGVLPCTERRTVL